MLPLAFTGVFLGVVNFARIGLMGCADVAVSLNELARGSGDEVPDPLFRAMMYRARWTVYHRVLFCACLLLVPGSGTVTLVHDNGIEHEIGALRK